MDICECDRDFYYDIFERDCYGLKNLTLKESPFILDVGAHFGYFSLFCLEQFKNPEIIAIECCPENLPILKTNVGSRVTILPKALTYQKDVYLLNSAILPTRVTCGASEVLSLDEIKKHRHNELHYFVDPRPLETITLEEIVKDRRVDILKLDCEGSEFSILENTTCLEQMDLIVGEWHGRTRWEELIKRRFSSWEYRVLRDGENGIFTLKPK